MLRSFLLTIAALWISVSCAQSHDTDSLLNELKKAKEDTNRVHLLRNIGVSLAHQDPQKAIGYWKEGATLSKKLGFDVGLARSYINLATGYSFAGKYDSALIYSDSAILYCHKIKDINRLALSYLNKADFYRSLQDFRNSLLHCDTALGYAEQTGNTDRLARIYDIRADIYARQSQFASAFSNLNKALELYRKDENAIMEGQVYSDFADMYKGMGKQDSAILYYLKAISIAEKAEDDKNLSTYHADLGDLYTTQVKYKEAETHILRSLEYARNQENNLQLAYAYYRLSNLYIKQGKYTDAISAGKQSYQFALAEGLLTHRYDAVTLLAEAYTRIQDYQNANHYLALSKSLNDSMVQQEFAKEIALLQNSFETREKDKEILLLSQEKQLQEQRLSRQRVLTAGSVILVLLTLVGVVLLINRYRMRNRMKELKLRNQIAADLHDEVGSSLSSIHMLSQIAAQKQSPASSDEILQRVGSHAQETMEKMSDIVWMIKPVEKEGTGLVQRMQQFMHEMCGETDIDTSLEVAPLERAALSMSEIKNIYLVFKEALNNAVKYAGASKIDVKAEYINKELVLAIIDNGRGFDTNRQLKGNGLRNMQNRAKELGGRLELVSGSGSGTFVRLFKPA